MGRRILASARLGLFLPGALFAGVTVVAAIACTSSKEPTFPEDDAKLAASVETAAPPVEQLPPDTVSRRDVDHTLLRGAGILLTKMQMEPVIRTSAGNSGGKFFGWRLISFPAQWDRFGLQPGDIVTSVNGMSLEREDDVWDLWISLSEATEVRFEFERDGKMGSAITKIAGDVVPDTRKQLEAGVMIASSPSGRNEPGDTKPSQARRFDTKVIGGAASEPVETTDY